MEVERDRVTDYVRIRKGKARDPDIIHKGLQKGFRIEHPERIAGYAGFFCETGDVYAIKHIARWMECEEKFRLFVDHSLERFEKGDYGEISNDDRDENIENRWLFGIDRLFGRYGFNLYSSGGHGGSFDTVICIRKHQGNTWITCDSDPDWFLFLTDVELAQLRDLEDPEPEE